MAANMALREIMNVTIRLTIIQTVMPTPSTYTMKPLIKDMADHILSHSTLLLRGRSCHANGFHTESEAFRNGATHALRGVHCRSLDGYVEFLERRR